MSKMDDTKAKAKKIIEDMEANHAASTAGTHTEVNVETNSTQTVSSGSVPSGDASPQVAELTADLQRLQAEFANYKRRAETERAEVVDFAKTRVVREFLAVRDSFDAELTHRPTTVDPKWAASIDAIRAQFDKVLASLGVARFESKGQAFDPNLHEAIAMEDGEGAHEIVAEELSPGYRLGNTILRHAMVRVSQSAKAPAAGAATSPAGTAAPAAEASAEPEAPAETAPPTEDGQVT